MSQSWGCPKGHHWQVNGDTALAGPGEGPSCPVCAAAGAPLSGPDETLMRPVAPSTAVPAPDLGGETLPPPPKSSTTPTAGTSPPPRLPFGPGPLPLGDIRHRPRLSTERPPEPGATPYLPVTVPPPQHAAPAAGDTLQRPAGTTPVPAPRFEMPPIAGYEILEVLGRGGMGVVYKARQTTLNRTVALKMILAGSHAGRDDLLRFRVEGEAVARLRHPNIVQIYEVGERDGLPFVSLEYVEGGSLQQKLSGTPMPVREAATLIEALARAIHHAHEQGIVHRDLKPANILLDRDGAPKIADFGLAKRLEDETGHTGTGAILGTPNYMAPEQAQGRNKEIGPPADVYALGAILYDLLTGRPPFKGETVLDTLQLVQSVEPVPPRRLQPKVPHDLETVCLKCLEKEPNRRYLTAQGLANDLRAFLDGLPIKARPTPAWERALKWARRRPAAAALIAVSAAAVLLAAIGGVAIAAREHHLRGLAENEKVAALREKQEADRQRDRANANLRQAFFAGEELLTQIGRGRLLNEPRMEGLRRELLERARRYYESFVKIEGDTPAVRWQIAKAHRRVGDIEEQLGQYDQALRAYDTALPLLRGRADGSPDDAEYLDVLGGTHTNRGVVLQQLKRHKESEQAYAEGVAILRRVSAHAEPYYRHELARVLDAWATAVKNDPARAAEAEKAYREALAILDKLCTDHTGEAAYRARRARVLANLGEAVMVRDPRTAEASWAQALEILDGLVKEDPDTREYRAQQGRALLNLAVLREKSQAKQAARAYRQAADLFEKLVDDFPRVTDYRDTLARAYTNLGVLLEEHGEFKRAEDQRKQARKHWERLAAEAGDAPEYRKELARSYADLGKYLRRTQEVEGAKAAWGKALELQEKLVKDFPGSAEYEMDLARSLIDVGQVVGLAGDALTEEGHYRRAIALLGAIKARGAGVPPGWLSAMGSAQHNLVALLLPRQEWVKGAVALQDALGYQAELVAAAPKDTAQRKVFRSYYVTLLETQSFLGDPAGVRKATAAFAPLLSKSGTPDELVHVAGLVANCARLVEGNKALSAEKRQELTEAYGDAALGLLREAVRAGFRDARQLRDAAALQRLANRAAFRQLLQELEGKNP